MHESREVAHYLMGKRPSWNQRKLMKPDYRDIRERIPQEPKWFDENGVPRYCDFSPEECSTIYAKEAVLLEIACQMCAERFDVELVWDGFMDVIRNNKPRSLSSALRGWLEVNKEGLCPLHYGDPPIHDCAAGNTMNCVDLRAKEFWVKEQGHWKRIPELEVDLGELDELK